MVYYSHVALGDTGKLPTYLVTMAGRDLLITFSAYDRVNSRSLYIKADGKRFGSSQTLKICSEVKYDVTITIKPHIQNLE